MALLSSFSISLYRSAALLISWDVVMGNFMIARDQLISSLLINQAYKLRLVFYLVGGFNPFEKYWSNWIISPGRGENKNVWNHHPVIFILYHESQCFFVVQPQDGGLAFNSRISLPGWRAISTRESSWNICWVILTASIKTTITWWF